MEQIDIKRAIKSRGKTISEVARFLGVTPSALTQQIIGKSMSIARLQEIADFFNITPSELLNYEDHGEKKSNNTTPLVCPHCGKPISIKIE